MSSYILFNGSDNYFHRAIRKYGIGNIKSIIIENNISIQTNILTKQTLANEKEIYYIEKYNTFKNGYNMTRGGEATLGYKHKEETKEKMSLSHIGIIKTEETKLKISIGNKGKFVSDSTKKLLSKSNPKYMLGLTHSEEVKMKMSKSAYPHLVYILYIHL